MILLASCSMAQKPAPTHSPSTPTVLMLTTPAKTDSYEVRAWVDKPEPVPGQMLVLSGSLIKNGVHLNGLMMGGFWQRSGEATASQHCYEFVNYQRGKCNIQVDDFPLDIYVPITIRIYYQGIPYTAETGFTPRGN